MCSLVLFDVFVTVCTSAITTDAVNIWSSEILSVQNSKIFKLVMSVVTPKGNIIEL